MFKPYSPVLGAFLMVLGCDADEPVNLATSGQQQQELEVTIRCKEVDGVQRCVLPEGSEVIGHQGETGSRGPRGHRGHWGLRGHVGPTGVRGLEGPRGMPGPRGVIGPHGLRGRTGLTGRPGSMGSQGVPGRPGRPGENGTECLKLKIYDLPNRSSCIGVDDGIWIKTEESGVSIYDNGACDTTYGPVICSGLESNGVCWAGTIQYSPKIETTRVTLHVLDVHPECVKSYAR